MAHQPRQDGRSGGVAGRAAGARQDHPGVAVPAAGFVTAAL
jgi:hypothetical protein